jgi:RNA polymerase sigma factor (sigma-70 family)
VEIEQMTESLESLVARARDGDVDALERLVLAIQDPIYRIAVHMLWHPEDAKDAMQEILIRIITRLDSFRGESAFTTWTYRIAVNWLLNAKRGRMETTPLDFDGFAEDLATDLSETPADDALLAEEVKLGCTLGMLLCLDRDERIAFILGEILELDGNEASEVLEIAPAAFRKRLSRARQSVVEFTRRACGLVNEANACRCARRVMRATELGRVDPKNLLFARRASLADLESRIRDLDQAQRAVAMYRIHQPSTPELADFVRTLKLNP